MKSQDIFLLLKLISLNQQEEVAEEETGASVALTQSNPQAFASRYTVRGLEVETGVSKSEISQSLQRSIKAGLVKLDHKTNFPRTNTKALVEFIIYGLKYVFPAEVSHLSRGIPTSFAAPVLQGKVMSAGESIFVWPDAEGKNKGQSVQPLYKTVPMAVKLDPLLYKYLALVDAIRLGGSRESAVAVNKLKRLMPVLEIRKTRQPGTAKGQILAVSSDFDELPADFEEHG